MAGAGFRLGLRTVFVVDLLVANGSGGNPLSRPQPPEAVAEGQSLQGIASRPNSATQSDVRRHFATTTVRRQHLHLRAWRGSDRQETANFKPMIFSEIHAAGDREAQHGHAEPVIGPGPPDPAFGRPGGRLQLDSGALPIGFLESSYQETFFSREENNLYGDAASLTMLRSSHELSK